jgi:hypothetical protein
MQPAVQVHTHVQSTQNWSGCNTLPSWQPPVDEPLVQPVLDKSLQVPALGPCSIRPCKEEKRLRRGE